METSKTKELSNFHYISLSDVGARRTNNEDCHGYFDTVNGHVFAVCDGCGGLPCGEKASQTVVNSLKFFFSNYYYKDPVQAIKDAVDYSQTRLIEEGRHNPECAGMATTLVLVLVRYNKAYYANIGDSRIYHFARRELKQLTKDDSYVQTLVDRGEITQEEAENHPRKNELVQALGIKPSPIPHISTHPLEPNDGEILLLCTDGLYNMVPPKDISATLSRRGYIEDKADELLKTAIANGGFDNITLQIIKFYNMNPLSDNTEQTPLQVSDTEHIHTRTPVAIAILSMIFIILGVLMYLKEEKKKTIHHHVESTSASNAAYTATFAIESQQCADSIAKIFGIESSQAVFFSSPDSTHYIKIPVKAITTARYYDNLHTLEMLYGTPANKIKKANGITGDEITPASEIIIPF